MSDLSWEQAALRILADSEEPLRPRAIVERIKEAGLKRDWQGSTPHQTVAARLSVLVNKNDPRVRRAGRGLYAATDHGRRVFESAENDDDAQQGSGTEAPDSESAESMTFLDAAEHVLKSSSRREPMHYREITRLALERGLLTTSGATPAGTMNAQLSTDIRRREERGQQPRFVKRGRGAFGLAVWEPEGLRASLEHHRQAARAELLEQVRSLEPRQFETLSAQLLTEMGVVHLEVTPYRGDQGVDLRGELVVV